MKNWRRSISDTGPFCRLTGVQGIWEVGPELITISWSWDGEDPFDFYIERKESGGDWEFRDVVAGSERSFEETSVGTDPGTYIYRVQARDDEAEPFDCLVLTAPFAIN